MADELKMERGKGQTLTRRRPMYMVAPPNLKPVRLAGEVIPEPKGKA